MKKWKWVTWTFTLSGISLLILAFTPVPQPVPENCYRVTGVVKKVYVPCCGDVAIELEGDEHLHYIDRGEDHGIDVSAWNDLLTGNQVTLQVIRRHWTPLDPTFHLRSVAAVTMGQKTLYNQIHRD